MPVARTMPNLNDLLADNEDNARTDCLAGDGIGATARYVASIPSQPDATAAPCHTDLYNQPSDSSALKISATSF
jgi:hypothetical protein